MTNIINNVTCMVTNCITNTKIGTIATWIFSKALYNPVFWTAFGAIATCISAVFMLWSVWEMKKQVDFDIKIRQGNLVFDLKKEYDSSDNDNDKQNIIERLGYLILELKIIDEEIARNTFRDAVHKQALGIIEKPKDFGKKENFKKLAKKWADHVFNNKDKYKERVANEAKDISKFIKEIENKK